MNFDTKDPKNQILLGFIIIIAAICYLFYNYAYSPAKEEISEKEKELNELQNKYQTAKRVADRLPEAKKELKRLEDRWQDAQRKLPNSTQMEKLLVELSSMGVNRGITFDRFTPENPRPPKGFYQENIINIGVEGSYHQLAQFFSDVANLKRIVRVDKVNINAIKSKGDEGNTIEADFQAIAYEFVQGGGGPGAKKN